MLVNPNTMIAAGFVKNLVDEQKQVQPNAIDFTVDQIQVIEIGGQCTISEFEKVMRKQTVLPVRADGYWELHGNREYDIVSNVYVEVPEGKAAILVLRSTFVRNGMWLVSGLYDSGFKGNIGAVLHTPSSGVALVAPGTRIGQIMFVESDSAGLYAGGYNTTDGQHWTEKNG